MRWHNLRLCVAVGAAALTGACTLMPGKQTSPPPATAPAQRIDPSLAFIAEQLQAMEHLALGTPTEQAEIFQAAREAFDITPNVQNRLVYALVLATPGHGAVDTEGARQQLATLLAVPETLLTGERTLAQLVLQNVEQRLVLQAETKRLQAEIAGLQQRQRNNTATRRLQEETEENQRLRKALAEAQSKLDEIARVERSLTERNPPQN
jgi:hypothetical protein